MSKLALIESRRAEIAAAMQELDERRSTLEAELQELDIAARVITRLTGDSSSGAERPARTDFARSDVREKPENTPTVPEMILSVLRQAKQDGFKGLEPKQMRSLIAEKWWPDVRGETVNSIAWRMWKRQQIAKQGSLYMLSS